MIKVFIGGSRKITSLSRPITDRLDNIINSNFAVLIGDANGVDKYVQKYLADVDYRNVTVFCSGKFCRNNIGKWEIESIDAENDAKGFNFYVAKDQQMAKEASYGFMIWDAKSKGTLNNVINLLKDSKKVLIYFVPGKVFYTLRCFRDLPDLLEKCELQDREMFEEKLAISRMLSEEQHEFELS